ncbi:outer membrane protein [Mariniflexile gromovii]|uniref:Outer membrane beta-barrel protein n=1 Tax=Mariniflexile gromovii TaxID=362523 RepID=A0ABS4BSM6_9FLAO|nr:outer membrane beta-barrel protein [Mariniflexile gromovii]MBP0903602.1 outer membrane beta-barrel protein [Mariniflexile gromovii]
MIQKSLLVLLLFFSIKSFSQNSKFSLELNYPIPIDKNFVGENYSGIIDLGAKFRFAELNILKLGASLNSGILVNDSRPNNEFQDFKITAYLIQPRIFAELDMESIKSFHPFIGLGYTFIIFDAKGTQNGFDISGGSQTQSGLNINLGIAYNITDKLFAQVQYDYVKISLENEIPDIKYNTNVNILKIGLGYRL